MSGPFCAECGKDTQGDSACYVPAPKQGGPFYYCHECRPSVNFLDPRAPSERIDERQSGV